MKRYEKFAQAMRLLEIAEKTPDPEKREGLIDRAEEKIESEMITAPSGSGFDSGTNFLKEKSTKEKLIFQVSFHHMNEMGYYIQWTDHIIKITPSFIHGINLKVSGRNYRDTKDYIGEIFYIWLTEESYW